MNLAHRPDYVRRIVFLPPSFYPTTLAEKIKLFQRQPPEGFVVEPEVINPDSPQLG